MENLTDRAKKPVPDHLADNFKVEAFERLSRALRRFAVTLKDHQRWNPYIDKETIIAIKQLAEHISGFAPYLVCDCGGMGCVQCQKLGWLPKVMCQQFIDDHKKARKYI